MSKADHVTNKKPSIQFWLENHPAEHLAGNETNHDIFQNKSLRQQTNTKTTRRNYQQMLV